MPLQQRRRLRRFQLRLPRRQLHLHSRKDQRRPQLRYLLHRHGLRNVQAEERRIIPFQKIHRKVYFLFLPAKTCGFRFHFHAFLCSKEKRCKRSEKSLQDLSALVTSALPQNFLRLPEWKFCYRQNLLGTTAHFCGLQIFRSLQNGTHHNQSFSRL